MKRFLMSTVAAGITLSMLGAPLALLGSSSAMAQVPPGQHMPPPGQHMPPPPNHEMHPPPPPPPPRKVVHNTTINHTTIVHNTTNYNEVHNAYPPHPGPPHPYVYTSGHVWHHGDYYNGNRYYVNNWQQYHLYAPPQGYQWVQDGGQFVLIAVASGIITDVILNAAYQ